MPPGTHALGWCELLHARAGVHVTNAIPAQRLSAGGSVGVLGGIDTRPPRERRPQVLQELAIERPPVAAVVGMAGNPISVARPSVLDRARRAGIRRVNRPSGFTCGNVPSEASCAAPLKKGHLR